MRSKNTVYSLETHNQFEGSAEDIKLQKRMIKERLEKDGREGQSSFRVKKQTQKKG